MFLYVGDPNLLFAFLKFVDELGCKVVKSVVNGREKHIEQKYLKEEFNSESVFFEPTKGEFKQILNKAKKCNLNLVIGNSLCHEKDIDVMEFGFPSYYSNALFENLFLGFRGAPSFIDINMN